MSDPGFEDAYRPPEAELREELLPRSYRNPTLAALTGLAALMSFAVLNQAGASYLPMAVASAGLGGMALLPLPGLGWYWAALLGIPLATGAMMVLTLAGNLLGIG